MLFFIVTVGYALQCYANSCTQIPMEAVQEMIRFGILELVLEVGGYSYYIKKYKKKDDDE